MKKLPDDRGYFGAFGGRFVPETLMAPLAELEEAYRKAGRDRGFQARLDELLEHYVGRPTPIYLARRLSARLGGARTCATPVRTRSTMLSDRRCSPARWVRHG